MIQSAICNSLALVEKDGRLMYIDRAGLWCGKRNDS